MTGRDELLADALDFDAWQARAKGTFAEYLGCKPVRLSAEEAVAELEIQPHHLNVLGFLHGGVHASLLDTVMGSLAMANRPSQPVVTSNLNLHYLAPVSGGQLRVEARRLHASARTITVEGRVWDEADALLALATGTFRVVGGMKH